MANRPSDDENPVGRQRLAGRGTRPGHSDGLDDLDDEVRLHLDLRTADLVKHGMSEAAARRQARLEFGGVEGYKEQVRDDGSGLSRSGRWLAQSWRDTVMAARRLGKAPWFTLFAVVSLAVGVAVTTTVYAIVQDVFWKPLGVARPDTLMVLETHRSLQPLWRQAHSRPDVDDYRVGQQSLASVAIATPVLVSMSLGPTFEVVAPRAVSGNYFQVLGVKAALGRLLGPSDDLHGGEAVVVLSDRLWRRAFASDPGVIGQVVRLADRPFQIIGVTDPAFTDFGFNGPARSVAWITNAAVASLPPEPAQEDASSRWSWRVTLFGRLRTGVTKEQASAEAAGISVALDRSVPSQMPRGVGAPAGQPVTRQWTMRSMSDIEGDVPAAVTLTANGLIAITALVLMVACTNLANLSMARGALRRHESAIRRSLGASRGRLIRGLVVESALIAVMGAALAVFLLRVLLVVCTVDLPAAHQQSLSLAPAVTPGVVLFSVVAVLFSLAVFGVQPAFRLTRNSESAELARGAQTVVASPRSAWRLIRLQVGIACAFLFLASTAVQYVVMLSRDTSGVDLDRLGVGTVVLLPPRWSEAASRVVIQGVMDRLSADRTIESAAAATGMPFGMDTTPNVGLVVPAQRDRRTRYMGMLASTPRLFATLGIGVEKGRAFDERDSAGAPLVAILSDAAARQLFDTTDVVGRTVEMTSATNGTAKTEPPAFTLEIVGVAADTDVETRLSRTAGILYTPFSQQFSPGITIAVRAADPARGVRAIRSAVAAEAPSLVVEGAGPAAEMLAPALPLTRVAAGVALALGGIALVLSMIGLHGVLAHLLASRAREMGLRMALGATPRQLERMALLQGLRPVGHGLLAGVFLGSLARFGLFRMSHGYIPLADPLAIVVVPVLFACVACVACFVPVRRAARVDPNVVLKAI